MKLTKNEKVVLNLLLKNARISDSLIATKLKISSQAVGKIRRKLEKALIDSYTANLNYSKLGIKVFAISLSKLTSEGLDKGELEVEEKLLDNPNIIQIYRLPSASATHIIFYGFGDLNELDEFFHSPKTKKSLHNFIETIQLLTFSHNSIIKNNPVQLFQKMIENVETYSKKGKIKEIENFKKKILN